jgi:DNA-binding transcriptional regulator YiaG
MPWPTEGNRGQKRGYGSVFKTAAIRWGIYLEKPADTLFLTATGNNIAGIKRSIAAWDKEAMEKRLVEVTHKEETAARVAELRKAEPDITQEQVAETLGLTARTVRKYRHEPEQNDQTSLLEDTE